jgi:hypothetical protein
MEATRMTKVELLLNKTCANYLIRMIQLLIKCVRLPSLSQCRLFLLKAYPKEETTIHYCAYP